MLLIWDAATGLGKDVLLWLALPATLTSSFLVTLLSRASVPVERYCDVRAGSSIESLGFVWSPVGSRWRSLSVPLAMLAVNALGLLSLEGEFDGFGATPFNYLSWITASFVNFVLIVAVMRAADVARPLLGHVGATWAGGGAGLAFGVLTNLLMFRAWHHPGVAVMAGQAVFFLVPFATAFVAERLLLARVSTRGPSKTLTSALAALGIATFPGIVLLLYPPEPPRAASGEALHQEWWLARVPVDRSFRVDFPQKVRVRLAPGDRRTATSFEFRLAPREATGVEIPDGREWDLAPGTYRLVVTVRNLDVKKRRLRAFFQGREGYASAAGIVARRLLESSGRTLPKELVGAYRLELVLNAEAARLDDRPDGGPGQDPTARTSKVVRPSRSPSES